MIDLDADGEAGPELLSFFCSLSPNLALYFKEPRSTEVQTFIECSDKVMELNLRIARTSHSHVRAANATALEALKQRLER